MEKLTAAAKLFRFRVWVGPTIVRTVALGFRTAGAVDVTEGTEHVFLTYSGDDVDQARRRAIEALRELVIPNAYGLKEYDLWDCSKI